MYGCAISLLFLTIAITWYPNREGLQDRQVRKKLESAHQLGWYYADRGEFDKASELFRESFEMGEEELGLRDPLTLTALNNLGWAEKALGDYSAAHDCFEKVYRCRAETLGKSHNDTLVSNINLASVLWVLGDLAKTESIYKDILKFGKRTFLLLIQT